MSLNFTDLHPLTCDLPPIAMFCTFDLPGAGGAAMELNTALSASGADVTLYVMEKHSNRARVREIAQGPKLQRAYSAMAEMLMRKHPERSPYFEMFSVVHKPVGINFSDILHQEKILHFHWMAGMLGFPKSLNALSDKPIVWTLHDMNPLVGGCHYTSGCGKYFEGGCCACPQLGTSTDGDDVAARNFSAKKEAYPMMNMTVVSPSTWQLDCMEKSILLGNVPRVKISNSVDPCIFFPRPRTWARAALGLPQDRKIIAFGAASIERWNKGAQVLKLALEALRSKWQGALPTLIVFGYGDMESLIPKGYECIGMGKSTQAELAVAYSAADMFVSASLQETFGLVTAEVQACGTPAIGFYGTGAEDIIEHGRTGFLVAHPGLPLTKAGRLRDASEFLTPEKLADLVNKIMRLLTLPEKQAAAMHKHCRENALEKFSPVLSAAHHLQLYRHMLGLPKIHMEGLPE